MPHFHYRTPVDAPAEALYQWHARPGAIHRLTPPWQSLQLVRHEGIRDGDVAVFRIGPGPASVEWVARHYNHIEGRQFADTQTRGPFKSWRHVHRFLPDGDGSVLEDEITYELPLRSLSSPLAALVVRQLERAFAYRHRVTQNDVVRHHNAALSPLTVAITGSTGLVGSALTSFFLTGGHRVVRLVRSRADVARYAQSECEGAVYWNIERGEVDEKALAAHAPDVVIHLAAESVYGLGWTNAKKRRIWESRTKGTQLLSRALARMEKTPRHFLTASASGFYGSRGEERLAEFDQAGNGFLADVCKAWEASTHEAEKAGIPTTHMRFGVVLTPAGGALDMMLPIFRLGLGGSITGGPRFIPWIAMDDLLYAVLHVLDLEITGPVNFGVPDPPTLEAFSTSLGDALGRPTIVPVPRPLLQLAGGELAQEIALASTRMVPQKLLDTDYSFSYPTIDQAFSHLL